MMQVKLTGKTLKGKNRVREHGDTWNVVFSSPSMAPEGKMIVESLDKKDLRWIFKPPIEDNDFIVEIVSE